VAISPNQLAVRTWERGSAETLACGTGACAVAFAWHSVLLAETLATQPTVMSTPPVTIDIAAGQARYTIHVAGGDLDISFIGTDQQQQQQQQRVVMTAEAEVVYQGCVAVSIEKLCKFERLQQLVKSHP
jgi:diaminopimelate epimerase